MRVPGVEGSGPVTKVQDEPEPDRRDDTALCGADQADVEGRGVGPGRGEVDGVQEEGVREGDGVVAGAAVVRALVSVGVEQGDVDPGDGLEAQVDELGVDLGRRGEEAASLTAASDIAQTLPEFRVGT